MNKRLHRLRTVAGWRADLAAMGLGALSAAALPPLHVIPVLLLAVPGLLLLIDAAPGPWTAARRGFCARGDDPADGGDGAIDEPVRGAGDHGDRSLPGAVAAGGDVYGG